MRGAFSMLELVFVIVILGILAAIAIPRFSLTRIDAQVVAIENDINNAISTIQREVFSQNLDPKTLTISQIFTLAGLSPSRWVIQGNTITLGKNATSDTQNSCVNLSLTNAILEFSVTQKADSTLCEKLFARHLSGGKKVPLNTSNAIF
ncbi:type II secretion system protein [uncultured Helicobacter sp.]|uniref:type II secretion system protein n=1 Tax=uncultured Helicobacter sp. TaxID=175537 RepID=UPI00374E5CA7